MARRKKGRAVDGVLLFNKDVGITSNTALQRARHLYQAQKAGHGGTLDPFADGLLPILFGEATKFGQYLLGDDKCYLATAQFGAETDTDDKDGKITKQSTIPDLNKVDWQTILSKFIGRQQQTPPAYSALKINGQRAYDLARQGHTPHMQPRDIVVHDFQLLSCSDTTAIFTIHCGKGTYVRALIRDVARALDTSAHTIALTRTSVGQLSEPNYRYDDIKAYDTANLDKLLLPVEACVQMLPKLHIPSDKFSYLVHGNDVHIDNAVIEYANSASHASIHAEDMLIVALYHQARFLGVGHWHGASQRVYPKRLLGHLSV